jgi:hypothetical protein
MMESAVTLGAHIELMFGMDQVVVPVTDSAVAPEALCTLQQRVLRRSFPAK